MRLTLTQAYKAQRAAEIKLRHDLEQRDDRGLTKLWASVVAIAIIAPLLSTALFALCCMERQPVEVSPAPVVEHKAPKQAEFIDDGSWVVSNKRYAPVLERTYGN